jgi:hypothetical protein
MGALAPTLLTTMFVGSTAVGRPDAALASGTVPSENVRAPSRREQLPRRRGTGLIATGAALTGIGVAGRFALEGFWFGVVGLDPKARFGTWSVANIALVTNMNNVFVLSGAGLLAGGLFRRGRWAAAKGRQPYGRLASKGMRRLGWSLFGAGIGAWVVSRWLSMVVIDECRTNACVYGFLESTYWLSAALAIPGLALAAHAEGFSQRAQMALQPLPVRGGGGLQLGGRF